MRAYRVRVGNDTPLTFLAEDDAALFHRLHMLADADDVRLVYMTKYSSTMIIEPLGEVQ